MEGDYDTAPKDAGTSSPTGCELAPHLPCQTSLRGTFSPLNGGEPIEMKNDPREVVAGTRHAMSLLWERPGSG